MTRILTELAPVARRETLVLGLYTTAVFLSALLLFGVQPMFARMVLNAFTSDVGSYPNTLTSER